MESQMGNLGNTLFGTMWWNTVENIVPGNAHCQKHGYGPASWGNLGLTRPCLHLSALAHDLAELLEPHGPSGIAAQFGVAEVQPGSSA